ncbi:MAG: DUF1670 domain-containing protein [Desulfobacula sp.]|nr:DUF1670 domain-containing protein [Desulfobacula sp.]
MKLIKEYDMLPISQSSKRYKPVHKRFLKPAIENFFKTEFTKFFGPSVRSFIADELIKIFQNNNRNINSLKPGQVLWNAIHKDTRADSSNMKLVPVILTLVSDNDISNLENGLKVSEHKQNVIARMLKEAYAQGALLSMRDVSLLLAMSDSSVSLSRKKYEKKYNINLPHPGSLQDMGSCITHKYQIIYKCVIEKKDPVIVAKETNHTIMAVDRYLKDFNRVKTLYLDKKNEDYIHLVTKLSLNVIAQYINIINQYIKEPDLTI